MMEFSKILKKVKNENIDGRKKPVPEESIPHAVQEKAKTSISSESLKEAEELKETVEKEIQPVFAQEIIPKTKEKDSNDEKAKEGEGPLSRDEDQIEASKESEFPVVAEEKISAVYPGVEDAFPLYEKILFLAKQTYRKNINYEELDITQTVQAIAEIAGVINAGNQKLIDLAITYILKEPDAYLFQHVANVSIISIVVGSELKYEMEKLVELGVAAFFHDIGLVGYEDMAKLPRKLTQKEYEEIKKHVDRGHEILKKIHPGLTEPIIAAEYESHERLDGSGYPMGKKNIHDYARIIAVADGFESMIHPRPFRPRYSIVDVYKRILEVRDKYDQSFIKVLFDKIGFFPTGSYVKLNTKEVGKVIRQNLKSPLRPVVRIVYGPDGQRLYEDEMKEVNLIKYPTIHVKECFLENEERGKASLR